MSSIGVALVTECVSSYNQRRLKLIKAVLSIYIAAKDVLPTLHYQQDRVL